MYKTIKYNFSFGRVDGNQIFKSAYYLRTFYPVPTDCTELQITGEHSYQCVIVCSAGNS